MRRRYAISREAAHVDAWARVVFRSTELGNDVCSWAAIFGARGGHQARLIRTRGAHSEAGRLARLRIMLGDDLHAPDHSPWSSGIGLDRHH